MATTARELLALAREEASRDEQVTVEHAEAAITALGYAAHALQRLALAASVHTARPEPWTTVTQLIAACQATTAAWPTRPGRLPDLVGAACDVLTAHDTNLVENAPWTLAAELSRATRHCASAALRHAPYARIPTLRWVHAASVEVQRQAGRHPPEPGSGMALDLPIPAPHPVEAGHWPAVLNAAACLSRALRQECAEGPLSIRSALATIAAGEDAARRCALFASTNSRVNDGVWRHAPDAWQITHAALARFHDGNRRRNPEPSETVRAALGLQQALPRLGRDHRIDADDATALRTVANQLPLVARQLVLAARVWAAGGTLCAYARDLLRTDELVPANLSNSAVPATAEHLVPVVAASRVTERLSAALSAKLDRTAGWLGRQPQPQLTASHESLASDRQLQADAEWTARLAARVRELENPARLAI